MVCSVGVERKCAVLKEGLLRGRLCIPKRKMFKTAGKYSGFGSRVLTAQSWCAGRSEMQAGYK